MDGECEVFIERQENHLGESEISGNRYWREWLMRQRLAEFDAFLKSFPEFSWSARKECQCWFW